MIYDQAIIDTGAEKLKTQCKQNIEWAVVLGSGLSGITGSLKLIKEIPFEAIPQIPAPAVKGHGGKFIIAEIEGKTVLLAQGRVHCYEGYSGFETAITVGILGKLGVKKIILTNAAGGVNQDFVAGDIMAITDHINLLGENPLTGLQAPDMFLDLSDTYDKKVNKNILDEFEVKSGVYAAMRGPSYETPAEIRFLKAIGADAVGMSTVNEAIMARYYQMQVVGLSLITNMAAGITGEKLSHAEVLETGQIAKERMIAVVRYIMSCL